MILRRTKRRVNNQFAGGKLDNQSWHIRGGRRAEKPALPLNVDAIGARGVGRRQRKRHVTRRFGSHERDRSTAAREAQRICAAYALGKAGMNRN